MRRPIIQETVQGILIGRRAVPYKGADLPYPPIEGRWEASVPEKTWEECTLLPKKRSAPKIFSSSKYFILPFSIQLYAKREPMTINIDFHKMLFEDCWDKKSIPLIQERF